MLTLDQRIYLINALATLDQETFVLEDPEELLADYQDLIRVVLELDDEVRDLRGEGR